MKTYQTKVSCQMKGGCHVIRCLYWMMFVSDSLTRYVNKNY